MLIPAHTLRDLLTGTVLAASKDFTLPVLTTVHLAWTATGEVLDGKRTATLTATSTDRYRMHEGVVDHLVLGDDEHDGSALVDRRDVEALVKTLPRTISHRGVAPDAVVELHGSVLVVEVDGNTRRLPLVDAAFPKVSGLWPADDSRAMVDGVMVNPAYVADLVKVPTSKTPVWRWNFTGSRHGAGPTLVTPAPGSGHPAIAWRALIMPVRTAA